MSKEKREFTGVFIPAHIWISKELLPAEKMLLGEIDALSKKTGWCEASREHFAEWLQCDATNISYYFKKLEKLGFLEIERVPGKRSRTRVLIQRFYGGEGVNGINYTREPHSPLPVNPIHPTREPHSPEIQLKENNKNKSVRTRKKSSPLKTETPHVENEVAPPPDPGTVAYTTDPAELEMMLRTYYMARPEDWKAIKERLDRAAAQAGVKYNREKIADVVTRYCEWSITKGHTGWTYSQHNSRLRMWMADQPTKEQPRAAASTVTPTYKPRKPLITA